MVVTIIMRMNLKTAVWQIIHRRKKFHGSENQDTDHHGQEYDDHYHDWEGKSNHIDDEKEGNDRE